MITGYIGSKGGGKTFNMVRDVMESMKWGRRVVSNIKISFDWNGRHFEAMHIQDSQDFKRALIYEKKCTIVIDEASVFMSNYHWNKLPPEIIAKLAQERHFAVDLVYTSQGFGHTVSRLRSLTDTTYLCTRRSFWGLKSLPAWPFVRKSWNNKYQRQQLRLVTTDARVLYKQQMRLAYWNGVQSPKKFYTNLIRTWKVYPAEQRKIFTCYDTNWIISGSALVKMGNIAQNNQPLEVVSDVN